MKAKVAYAGQVAILSMSAARALVQQRNTGIAARVALTAGHNLTEPIRAALFETWLEAELRSWRLVEQATIRPMGATERMGLESVL